MIEDGRRLQMRQSVKDLIDVYIRKENGMKYVEKQPRLTNDSEEPQVSGLPQGLDSSALVAPSDS